MLMGRSIRSTNDRCAGSSERGGFSLRPQAQVEVEELAPDAPGVPVIAIGGEVDLSNAATLQAKIDDLV